MTKIIVEDTSITVLKIDDKAFISLTDMLQAKDGDFFLRLAAKPQYPRIPWSLGTDT